MLSRYNPIDFFEKFFTSQLNTTNFLARDFKEAVYALSNFVSKAEYVYNVINLSKSASLILKIAKLKSDKEVKKFLP